MNSVIIDNACLTVMLENTSRLMFLNVIGNDVISSGCETLARRGAPRLKIFGFETSALQIFSQQISRNLQHFFNRFP